MATYQVKLGSNDGDLLTRQVHGKNPVEVRRQLQNEGYFVFSVRPVFNLVSLLGLSRKLPSRKFLMFNKEFRGLVKAGLPIVEGLDILLKRMEPGRMRTMLEAVRARLRAGESLSAAFRAHEELIPGYYPALLHAGEQSGNQAEVLGRFIEQEDRLRKTRKRFVQSLTYPCLLMLVGLASAYIVMTRALPQFTAMYANSEQELPTITKVVIAASNWLNDWYAFLFGGLILSALALQLYRHTEAGARALERALFRVPLLGKVWSLQNQNIFARTMRMLIAGGIPVPQALAITADGMPSPNTRAQLHAAHQDVLQGQSLQEALEHHVHMEHMVGEMISIGEGTGTLVDMLDYLAEAGEERSDDLLERVTSLIAPLMLLAVGLMIAFMVIAMYLPMFGSYNTLGL